MPKSIVLDTDIDTDCDDAGALAVLHALGARDVCRLLGAICSIPVTTCTPVVATINSAYGQAGIPIGVTCVPDFESSPRWKEYRQHRGQFHRGEVGIMPFHDAVLSVPGATLPATSEAVDLYRRLLSAEPDGSVTICAIGTLTALEQLLASGPDEHSPLPGRDLVRAKVVELVSMAIVDAPEGIEEFNWKMDLDAATTVVRDWPGTMTVSSHGWTVLTGERFMATAPEGHPVREAYRECLGGDDRNRPSWDLIAALYASGHDAHLFSAGPSRNLTIDPDTGRYRWGDLEPGAPPRRLTTPTIPDDALADVLERLMIASLQPG